MFRWFLSALSLKFLLIVALFGQPSWAVESQGKMSCSRALDGLHQQLDSKNLAAVSEKPLFSEKEALEIYNKLAEHYKGQIDPFLSRNVTSATVPALEEIGTKDDELSPIIGEKIVLKIRNWVIAQMQEINKSANDNEKGRLHGGAIDILFASQAPELHIDPSFYTLLKSELGEVTEFTEPLNQPIERGDFVIFGGNLRYKFYSMMDKLFRPVPHKSPSGQDPRLVISLFIGYR